MHYIDDISDCCWTLTDFRKYQSYLELRKQRDNFLKSLKPGWYVDWLIQKKAIEAGGIGDTIYILPARGGSKSPYDRIEKYIEEGRDVQFVRPKDTSKKQINIEKFTETVLDWDLCCNRENLERYEAMDKYIDELIRQKLRTDVVADHPREKLWITSASPDAYIFDNKTYADWAMRDFLLNPNYGIVYKKED